MSRVSRPGIALAAWLSPPSSSPTSARSSSSPPPGYADTDAEDLPALADRRPARSRCGSASGRRRDHREPPVRHRQPARRTTGCASGPSTSSASRSASSSQLVFVPLLYWLLSIVSRHVDGERARPSSLTDRAAAARACVLLVLLVVVGAPIIEELFFRGLLLRSIQARWNDSLALVASRRPVRPRPLRAAAAPRRWSLFGLVAGYCAQRTGRLGMSILAHAGFNATTVVLLLAA